MTLAEFAAKLDEYSDAHFKVITPWLLDIGSLRYNHITQRWQLHIKADNTPNLMSEYKIISIRFTNRKYCYITVDWDEGNI